MQKSANPVAELERQLLVDMDRHNELLKRYAAGDGSVKQDLHELRGAIQVKCLVARAARRETER